MKHQTYEVMYQAHLGDVNKDDLIKARAEEDDPFSIHLLDILLKTEEGLYPWDIKPFTSDFLSEPKQRLQETFFAFIMFLVSIIKERHYFIIFRKPESLSALTAWQEFLRRILICSLALLFNVHWTLESMITILDPAVSELIYTNQDGLGLRRLMERLNIQLETDELYPSEITFYKMNFMTINQFSSFYWRFLHWMAEADAFRGDDMVFYRNMWRELILGPLYRTLRCGSCMFHFQAITKEMKDKILDASVNLPKLFFDIHNRVHKQRREMYRFLNEPDYTEEEYQKDSDFMIQALSP